MATVFLKRERLIVHAPCLLVPALQNGPKAGSPVWLVQPGGIVGPTAVCSEVAVRKCFPHRWKVGWDVGALLRGRQNLGFLGEGSRA